LISHGSAVSERHSISIRDRHGFERSVPAARTLVVGRQNQCDIVLSDSMVSRTHLKIEPIDGVWWVEDLGSSHGTFLGDDRITRMRWDSSTTLRLADGAYFLTLRRENAFASEVNLQAILQTAHLLTGEIELDELLEQTLDRLLAISATDRGFIMLPEGADLVVKVRHKLGQDMEKVIHLSMSSVRRVFDQGEAIWIHNVAENESLMAQQSVLDLQLKTILCLPLMVQGKCIGVVYLDSRRIVTEPVDRDTFEAIVSLCAIAIERTRLSEDNLRNQVLATVGQVASSIVHDFKNALFVVAGHAQMLGAASKDPQVQHHLEKILGAVERLSQLSTDVLDYAKVREPKREVVEVGSYLNSFVEPMRPRASEVGVTVRCDGPACKAHLDRHRFARVVENLLANALDAFETAEGTEVSHRPNGGLISVRWERISGGLRITVEDDGKGIPGKILKRIFEPFFSHGKAKGTGLGMATVKKIVTEHGGQVEVTSEVEKGTIVTLEIPDQGQRDANEDTTDRLKALGSL